MKEDVHRLQIGGIPIRVVKRHNYALIPWAEAKRDAAKDLTLITLDHHHDTKSGFVHYSGRSLQFQGLSMDSEDWLERLHEKQQVLLAKLDWKELESVRDAANKLDHDEHIDAAIKGGIFQRAIVICLQQGFDRPVSDEVKEYQEGMPSPWEMLQDEEFYAEYP